MSCFSSLFPSLPCLPSLEVDLMICTVGCDVSKLWSSTAGVSFNSILVFLKDFSCLPLFFLLLAVFSMFTQHKKSQLVAFTSAAPLTKILTVAPAFLPSLVLCKERGKFKNVTWSVEKHYQAFIITRPRKKKKLVLVLHNLRMSLKLMIGFPN